MEVVAASFEPQTLTAANDNTTLLNAQVMGSWKSLAKKECSGIMSCSLDFIFFETDERDSASAMKRRLSVSFNAEAALFLSRSVQMRLNQGAHETILCNCKGVYSDKVYKRIAQQRNRIFEHQKLLGRLGHDPLCPIKRVVVHIVMGPSLSAGNTKVDTWLNLQHRTCIPVSGKVLPEALPEPKE